MIPQTILRSGFLLVGRGAGAVFFKSLFTVDLTAGLPLPRGSEEGPAKVFYGPLLRPLGLA